MTQDVPYITVGAVTSPNPKTCDGILNRAMVDNLFSQQRVLNLI